MFISIIIPTFNRAKTLSITLNSILQQYVLDGFEVIIIDNGSTDNTQEICAQFLNYKAPAFRYYYDPEPGLLTGRHLGAKLAQGDILCFLDDDVALEPSWILGVRDAFSDPTVRLATGPSLPRYEVEPPDWLPFFWQKVWTQGNACTWLSLLDLGNEIKQVHPNFVWGLNFCIRKETLYSLKGFHPDNIPANLQMYQGDGETGLTLKVQQAKLKAIYHPKIKLHHLIAKERLTVEYFKKRAFYQGVCNSFTQLRTQYLLADSLPAASSGFLKKIFLKPLKQVYKLYKDIKTPKNILKLKQELAQIENEGFHYHQTAFRNEHPVRQWVLKPDYWDYKLPG